jgi:hypothetical protein
VTVTPINSRPGKDAGRLRQRAKREPQARRLSRAGKDLLVSRAMCDLSTRLRVDDGNPEGATHHRATYLVQFWLDDLEDGSLSPADARLLQRLIEATPDAAQDDGMIEFQVGHADFTVVANWNGFPAFEALDAVSADLSEVGQALLTGFDDLMDDLGGISGGVVIVDQVHVAPAWRGLRMGLIGTGLAVRELGRGSSVAVLYPMEPGTREEEARVASRARLTKYWAQLGFEPWMDDVMALSLVHITFEKRLARLCRPHRQR